MILLILAGKLFFLTPHCRRSEVRVGSTTVGKQIIVLPKDSPAATVLLALTPFEGCLPYQQSALFDTFTFLKKNPVAGEPQMLL